MRNFYRHLAQVSQISVPNFALVIFGDPSHLANAHTAGYDIGRARPSSHLRSSHKKAKRSYKPLQDGKMLRQRGGGQQVFGGLRAQTARAPANVVEQGLSRICSNSPYSDAMRAFLTFCSCIAIGGWNALAGQKCC